VDSQVRVKVNDVEYSISMKWNMNDTIQSFVEIDGTEFELTPQFHRERHDDKTYVTHQEAREMFAQEIIKILNA